MTPFEFGAVCATVALGAAVQGAAGFGFALVTAPILVLINPRLVPGPVLTAVLALALLMLYRERSSIDISGLKWALIGLGPGMVVGAAALVVIPERGLTIMFGLLVLSAVFLSVIGLQPRPDNLTLLGAGMLSGFMGIASSISGPPMALVYQDTDGARLRGTLSVYFVASTIPFLLALAVVGRFGGDELQSALALLPGVLAGFLVSGRAVPLLDRGYTRPVVLVVSCVTALAVLIRRIV